MDSLPISLLETDEEEGEEEEEEDRLGSDEEEGEALQQEEVAPADDYYAGGDLIVIVGRGRGSEGGRAVLGPAVRNVLQDDFGVRSLVDSTNAGRIRVRRAELASYVERMVCDTLI